MALAAAGLVALAVFVASYSMMSGRRSFAEARLARISRWGTSDGEDSEATGDFPRSPIAHPSLGSLSSLSSSSAAARVNALIDARLTAAGQPVSAAAFRRIIIFGPLALGALALISFWGTGAELLALMAVVFGLAGPFVWLSGRITRRRQRVNLELPDALDLIVVSLEAGLGFEAALVRITDRADGVLAEELRRVLADMNVGRGRRHALQALAARTGVPAISSLVSAILQAEQTGMSIAQVLRGQSDHLRVVRRQRAEEAAMKAPLKMLFPLVFFIFPSLFVVILGPAVLQLLQSMRSQ